MCWTIKKQLAQANWRYLWDCKAGQTPFTFHFEDDEVAGWSTRGFSMSLRHAKILARHAKKTPTCYATSYKNCDMLHLINNSTHEHNTVNYLLMRSRLATRNVWCKRFAVVSIVSSEPTPLTTLPDCTMKVKYKLCREWLLVSQWLLRSFWQDWGWYSLFWKTRNSRSAKQGER